MTLDEQLEILKAAKRGEKIEVKTYVGWEKANIAYEFCFDFINFEYRIADPYAELKAAAKDPTKQIRSSKHGQWWDATKIAWEWNQPVKFYEIRDKPKPKKVVKYLCVESPAGFLGWSIESSPILSGYKRRPAFDKECEVEDE